MLPGFLLTVAAGVLVVAVVVARTGDDDPGPRRAPPQDDGTFLYEGTRYDLPPPVAESDEPLGTPPTDVDPAAPHTFSQTQEGSDEPVTWDPCRAIEVVVDDRTVPDGGARLLAEALAQVSRATGLRIEDEGPTDEEPVDPRPPIQEDRYGNRWAPVLVAWTDPETSPALAGAVGGLGGNVAVHLADGLSSYVSGSLLLDGPQLQGSLAVEGGSDQVRSVILHELAHVIGLGHVEDPAELMYPEGQPGVFAYGPGDRAGLARLGQGPCRPDL